MKSLKLFSIFFIMVLSANYVFAENVRSYAPIDKSVPTAEKINSKIGKLEFPLGYPTDKTAQMVEDEMLYVNAVAAYTNTVQGASLWALRKGFAKAGINDGDFFVSPEMVDAKFLQLTANMDTYYFWGNVD